jgi:hypothetical protein
MAGLRFTELQSRPMEFLDFTSLTLDEFQQLVPPFETAFHARMAAWRMDGKPRTARRFTVYKNCPLLTPEDRLRIPVIPATQSGAKLPPNPKEACHPIRTKAAPHRSPIGAQRRLG